MLCSPKLPYNTQDLILTDTYLINIASPPFELSNSKQLIYYKLWPKINANYGSFIVHHDNPNYKLLQDYYKLRQKFITNYRKNLLQTTAKNCYKLRQLLFLLNSKLLQITSSFIAYYGNF